METIVDYYESRVLELTDYQVGKVLVLTGQLLSQENRWKIGRKDPVVTPKPGYVEVKFINITYNVPNPLITLPVDYNFDDEVTRESFIQKVQDVVNQNSICRISNFEPKDGPVQWSYQWKTNNLEDLYIGVAPSSWFLRGLNENYYEQAYHI